MQERKVCVIMIFALLNFKAAAWDAPSASPNWLADSQSSDEAQAAAVPSSPSQPSSDLWDPSGQGFQLGAQEMGLSAGAGFGMKIFGGSVAHDWGIGGFQYGYMLSHVRAPQKWFAGNWELMGEFFGGGQYRPDTAYFVGLAPLLRYNFVSAGRFVPFVDAGAGISATDIRNRDLSTTYEFNLQLGAGCRWFLKDNLALLAQYRFIHLSNASTHSPNLGVNTGSVMAGITWLF